MARLTKRISVDCIEICFRNKQNQYRRLPQRVYPNNLWWDIFEELCKLEDLEQSNRRSTQKIDIAGQEILEGDIIECHQGTEVLDGNLVIRYGNYQAYCPVDNCYMENVGFFASAKDLPDMPIGPTEEYARVIGNIKDNKDLVPWYEEDIERSSTK